MVSGSMAARVARMPFWPSEWNASPRLRSEACRWHGGQQRVQETAVSALVYHIRQAIVQLVKLQQRSETPSKTQQLRESFYPQTPEHKTFNPVAKVSSKY